MGGQGGGAVHLIVGGVLDLAGQILANGGTGDDYYGWLSGGGSGGSIWIETNTLTGAGSLQANGGVGGPGGGGGRIAVYYRSIQDAFDGFNTSSVDGGSTGAAAGSPGTLTWLALTESSTATIAATENLFLDVQDVQDGNVVYVVQAPDHSTVIRNVATSGSPDAADYGPFSAGSGQYTVLVYTERDQAPTLHYQTRVVPPVQPQGLGTSGMASGTIAIPGAVDGWQFDLAANARMALDLLSIGGMGQILMFTLVAPDGQTIFSTTGRSEQPADANHAPLTVTQSGTYTLLVDGQGDDTASYQFAVPGVQPADIRPIAIVTSGATLTVTYEIEGGAVLPFEYGFYRSADTAFGSGDVLAGSVEIRAAEDRVAGTHVKTFTLGGGPGEVSLPGAGAADTDFDYFLLAVADHANADPETLRAVAEGNNTAVFTGVYHFPGGPVMVHGTSGADTLKILPATGGGMQVNVNGTVLNYAGTDVNGVRGRGHVGNDQVEFTWGTGFGAAGGATLASLFIGGPGSNTAKLWGSTNATLGDNATVKPTYTTLAGQGYSILAKDLQGVTVYGQGGPDKAYLYDSTGNDTFSADPTYATLGTNRVENFPSVYAYASGGIDTAQFYAGTGNGLDQFSGSPTYATLTGPTGTGRTYYVRADSFETMVGNSSDSESDVATLFDAAGTATNTQYNFVLDAGQKYGEVQGGPGTIRSNHFYTTVVGSRDQGADTATLYGSAGADKVQFKLYAKEVWLVPTTGSAFKYRASQVPHVEAYSATGQSDTAEFYDSPESDAFTGSPNNGQMTTPSGLFASATDFRYINGFSTHTGTDTAALTGKTGTQDFFNGQPTQATLGDSASGTGTTYFLWLKGFESVKALGQGADGGRNDTAKLYGTAGHENFLSDFYPPSGSTQRDPNRPYAIFSGTGFANTASGFAFATAYGDANDAAQLYSAATTDVFIGSPVTSVMARTGVYYHEAKGFGEVHGHGATGAKAKLNDATTRQVLLELSGTCAKLSNRGSTPFAVWVEDFGDLTASALGSITQQKKKLADYVFALHTTGTWTDVA